MAQDMMNTVTEISRLFYILRYQECVLVYLIHAL